MTSLAEAVAQSLAVADKKDETQTGVRYRCRECDAENPSISEYGDANYSLVGTLSVVEFGTTFKYKHWQVEETAQVDYDIVEATGFECGSCGYDTDTLEDLFELIEEDDDEE